MLPDIIRCIIIFLFGIVIGSFLNVCIIRIPNKEDIVKTSSHCRRCGYRLKWYDMIPLVSFLVLRGKCRSCSAKLSVQYPLIEAANGILYVLIVWTGGLGIESLLYCLLASALLVLSVIDFRTYEIPFGINLFILVLGLIRVGTDYGNFLTLLIGFLSVSALLAVLYYATDCRAIGGGDVIRMKVSGAGHTLAMGPYLSMGVFVSALWGERMLLLYLAQFV